MSELLIDMSSYKERPYPGTEYPPEIWRVGVNEDGIVDEIHAPESVDLIDWLGTDHDRKFLLAAIQKEAGAAIVQKDMERRQYHFDLVHGT